MGKFDVVLIDADNTILDFTKAERESLVSAFHDNDLYIDDRILSSYININKSLWEKFEKNEVTKERLKVERFELLFKSLNISFDAVKMDKEYRNKLSRNSAVIDGAIDLCNQIRKMAKLYIVTNGVSETQYRRLNKAGILQYVNNVFVSEDAGAQKPAKEFFKYVFEHIEHCDLSRTIILGDSLSSDIQGGINAGISTCWFNPEGACNKSEIMPDFEIKSLKEFIGIIN